MKTILVPTDFSRASRNAARYAIQFAAKINAQIILLNTYTIPTTAYDLQIPVIPESEIRNLCLLRLAKLADKLHNETKQVQIKIEAVNSIAGSTIIDYANKRHAVMVVMGTHGETPAITRLFGNTTSYVLRESNIPVLAVPAFAKYREIRNVLVTCDLAKTFTEPILYALQNIAKIFVAKLNLVKVYNLAQAMLYGTTMEKTGKINEKLGDVPHEFHHQVMAETTEGINKAAKKHKADIVILIAHKNDFITRLFKGSTTKQVIESAKKPILVLPEKLTNKKAAHIFEPEKMLQAAE